MSTGDLSAGLAEQANLIQWHVGVWHDLGYAEPLPDERNMQCTDDSACDRRQDALLAASIVRSRAIGHEARFIRRTPGVLAALEDGERLRQAMATLDAVEGRDDRG